MSASYASGGVHGSGSVRTRAAARWNACGNENGAGAEGAPGAVIAREAGHRHANHEHITAAEMSLTY